MPANDINPIDFQNIDPEQDEIPIVAASLGNSRDEPTIFVAVRASGNVVDYISLDMYGKAPKLDPR